MPKTPQKTPKKINKSKNNKKRRQTKNKKNINLLYTNPDGITGKITSLISAANAANAHIIGLAETKIGKTPQYIKGYEWINKPRTNKNGGGVAILIREDIKHLTEVVNDLEDHDQEIAWIKLDNKRAKKFVGIYYGPQEKCSKKKLKDNMPN